MKLLKIFLLCIILSIALFSNVFAVEEELSSSLEILSTLLNEDSTTVDVEEEENIEEDTPLAVPTASQQVVTTSNSSQDEGLSISDIINIILIAVGLVLIFLAVAILLRSK